MQSTDFYWCLLLLDGRGRWRRKGTEDEGRAMTGEEEMGSDACDTGLFDPLHLQNGARQASFTLIVLCLPFSSRLPKGSLSYSQSCLNPHGSPAHATLHSNPQTYIASTCTHINKVHTLILQQSHWVILGSQNSAHSLWM